MVLSARITGIKYTPLLCRKLATYRIDKLGDALIKDASFFLEINCEKIAVSWWVSAKRTRSYPYARVYDTLGFSGKKLTIIPIVKDEGVEGDRDFLQWDTVSLMSLLGIYVIVAYYRDASQSTRYKNKIRKQKFDLDYIKRQIKALLSYQSDPLHWNLSQIDKIGIIGRKALYSYSKISRKLGVKMHSVPSAEKRIEELLKGKEKFMVLSRNLAKKAQMRESTTIQPKEKLIGIKAILTIKNYLGGEYYFTSDEVEINKNKIYLIEAKHTRKGNLPSLGDIKDGLLKMILFTNLVDVEMGNRKYLSIPVLKLTTDRRFNIARLSRSQIEIMDLLKKEAEVNGFELVIE
ncbi:MAG: hypothetical protein ACOZBZ_03625 [Patescibacteria group bacterium]